MARIVDSKQIHHYQPLIDHLAESWDRESKAGDELDIIVEQVDKPFGKTGFRLYVVTDKFDGVPMPLRAQIIVDAFVSSRRADWAVHQTSWTSEQTQMVLEGFESAIGAASPQEAARLGIPGYEEFE